MERSLTNEQTAHAAMQASAKEQMLLPPRAKPGQCFARAFMPPQYEVETVRVQKSDASKQIETIPSEFKLVEERVLVKEASERLEVVPATYEWVEERIVIKPASNKFVTIPAEYKTVNVRKLVKPANTRTIDIPAQYQTIQRRNMIADGHVEWRPVLCETNMSSDVVRRIQSALDSEGFPPGPVDGFIGPRTMGAVKRYQQTKGLASGGLTIETLASLKVDL